MPMGFPRQEHWRGCQFLLQGVFPTQGSNPRSCIGRRVPAAEPPGKPISGPTQGAILSCQPLHEEQPVWISYGASTSKFLIEGQAPRKNEIIRKKMSYDKKVINNTAIMDLNYTLYTHIFMGIYIFIYAQ